MITPADDKLDRLRKATFVLNGSPKEFVTVKGTTMPLNFSKMQEQITNLEVNENDVWICTFPKSGTTWTQEMVWMIVNNLDFEKGKELLTFRSPFLEFSAFFDYGDLMKKNNIEITPRMEDSVTYAMNTKSPRIIKCHLPFDLLPRQIQDGIKRPKIIYVARNPKDACVSYYHHCRILEDYIGTFEEYCTLFLGGKLSYAPYWKHILQFWNRKEHPNMIFMTFEEMKSDLRKVIRQVTEFLDRDLTTDQVEDLSNHLSFESMKKNPAVNFEAGIEMIKKIKSLDSDGTYIRSGKIGDHKSSMSLEFIKKFDKWIAENTAGTDFPFYRT